MLIDLVKIQSDKFDEMALKIEANPEHYLDFDSVADFYKAKWLDEFPKGTTWIASGLDDGAEEFYAKMIYKKKTVTIHIKTGQIHVKCCL